MDSQKVADLYDAHYYATGCGPLPYERNDDWLHFFDSIAEQILTEIAPHSILDAGCGLGFLVEGLRRRGLEAFGFDISTYAIEQIYRDIQPYCWVGSLTDPLPRKYDLITSIEVLEHLPPSEAKQAIENLCRYSDDILFSSTPLDYKEPTHFNVQPPEYWAELFAQQGFFRDIEFDASFITPWAVRFRRAKASVARVIANYERRLQQLERENLARREFSLELRHELAQQMINQKQGLQQIRTWETRWRELERSPGWLLVQKLQQWRARFVPPKSIREQTLEDISQALQQRQPKILGKIVSRLSQNISWHLKVLRWQMQLWFNPPKPSGVLHLDGLQARPPLQAHQVMVDIIICVHNALNDVQQCLAALVQCTNPPYTLILVDDGSDLLTHDYLVDFAKKYSATLIRNEAAQGYTKAANQGLKQAASDYVVLLNSDTIVTSGWLDRLTACAESDFKIGIVGPLSNTASWQSIPEIESQGDWAANPLPPDLTIEEMGQFVAHYSARLYPTMPFLNGFCLLIRQRLIKQIGYFDEENFGVGYGEENDYSLRARKAGWRLSLADDAYIYHAQSKSYSSEKRKRLSEQANATLLRKYGEQVVNEGVALCRHDRVLEGIRAHSRIMLEQQACIERGRALFAGRRVLFLLPIKNAGGGGNVVIFKARLMRQMGVEANIFNLQDYRQEFEQAYPGLDIPVTYGEIADVPALAAPYDAVVATANTTVQWLLPTFAQQPQLIRGYFIQDFEPYFYPASSEAFKTAWASYALIPDLVRFTTTEWIRQEVSAKIGVECNLIGPSFDAELFRPRPRSEPEWPHRPLRIGAMIRPESRHRAPHFTMEILQRIARKFGSRVEIRLFGTELDQDNFYFAKLPHKFSWQLAGKLNQQQVAQFLNEVDIFVDFSSHQALGITAQEAMACGVAVIVPAFGGTHAFARDGENCLVVDTASAEACEQALRRLIEDHALRARLQKNSIFAACAFYPEKPAFNILEALFHASARGSSEASQNSHPV